MYTLPSFESISQWASLKWKIRKRFWYLILYCMFSLLFICLNRRLIWTSADEGELIGSFFYRVNIVTQMPGGLIVDSFGATKGLIVTNVFAQSVLSILTPWLIPYGKSDGIQDPDWFATSSTGKNPSHCSSNSFTKLISLASFEWEGQRLLCFCTVQWARSLVVFLVTSESLVFSNLMFVLSGERHQPWDRGQDWRTSVVSWENYIHTLHQIVNHSE